MDQNYVTYDVVTGTPLVYKCGSCSCCGSEIFIDLSEFRGIIKEAVDTSVHDAIAEIEPSNTPFETLKSELVDYINSVKQELIEKLDHLCDNCNHNNDGGNSGGGNSGGNSDSSCGCININGLCNINHTSQYTSIETNEDNDGTVTNTIIDINEQNNGN